MGGRESEREGGRGERHRRWRKVPTCDSSLTLICWRRVQERVKMS